MGISIKQRHWVLGGALLLTVAAAASVGKQDDADGSVVQAKTSRDRVRHATTRPSEHIGTVAGDTPGYDLNGDVLLERLKRPALPEKVNNLFAAKSWYVPPSAPKVKPAPVAPPLPYVFIGKIQEAEDKYGVFLERQNRIFIVREGDAIDASYRVETIRPPLMTLTYLPMDIKQTVQIGVAN